MGDVSPSAAPAPSESCWASPEDGAGGAASKRPPAAPRQANETKALLKSLLQADALNVTHDISVALSFTYKGLTYTQALPVSSRAEGRGEAFPDVATLLDSTAGADAFKALLKQVVRRADAPRSCLRVARWALRLI